MKYPLTVILFFFIQISFGQTSYVVFRNPKDSSQNLYIVRPPKAVIKGVLVLNDRALSDSSKMKAYETGILTLTIVPTSNSLDNLMSDAILLRVDEMIKEVLSKYKIQDDKFIIGGMSAAGTGAIRYAQFCFSRKTKSSIKPIGVFAVDPPLDYERLWNEAEKSVQRNFNNDAVKEGQTLIKLLKKDLQGTPKTNIQSYRIKSPYCCSAPNGGNAYLLNKVAIRLYIEPDISWWINNRRKNYCDINAIDNAGLINQLKINGNDNAELIMSYGKGYREDGKRHPHSWSILDENELLNWCDKLFTETK